jgi:hypothetical protein
LIAAVWGGDREPWHEDAAVIDLLRLVDTALG